MPHAAHEELFDAFATVEPPLTADALGAIPARRGVFLLTAADGRPILLTTGADIRARLRGRLTEPDADQRTKVADLREITAAVHWKLATSPFETDWRFLEIARHLWPRTWTKLPAHKPAWFVAVDPDEPIPQFARTQEVGGTAQAFGPFPDRSSAERFVESLADAFDLCRYYHILRQAPHGTACAYKQMGRCPAPCDGSIPMEAYRGMIRAAARFAGGERQEHAAALARQMREAAGRMEFERAAVLKSRLERMEDFAGPKYAEVRPLEAFRYVIVQPGARSSQARAFVCDRGAIADAGALDLPLREEPLEGVLRACDALAAGHEAIDEADRWRMGLVAAYLFAGRGMRGLMLRRDELADAGALREAIEASLDDLKLRPAAPRGRRKKDASAEGAGGYNHGPGAGAG